MDFFESQELARKRTKWLICLFVIAVMAIVVAIYFLVVVAISMTHPSQGSQFAAVASDPRLIIGVFVGVVTLIGMGSLAKMFELRQGGAAVASLMGGRRIVGNTSKLTDQRVANIVEEMALASGTPVPPVYMLDDEDSINAFAAGFTVDDAVIGINRGTAEKLTREELQGVIAHEFSHILNGDMRTSLRMVGLLNGILLISIIGGQLLRFLTLGNRYSGRSRSNNDKGNGGFIIAMFVIAIGLFAIGSIGLFFGRWIKSLVSKQREYLADASAVQFTRMPDGIAGALKVIGGTAEASKMNAGAAEQISHMFFSEGISSFFFATHPPLVNRVQQIDERFDGDFQKFMKQRQRRYRELGDQRRQQQEEQKQQATDQSNSGLNKITDFIPGSDRFGGFDKFPINPLVLVAGIGLPDGRGCRIFRVNGRPDSSATTACDSGNLVSSLRRICVFA